MAGARSSFVRMSWWDRPVLASSSSMSRSVSLGPWRESSKRYAFLSLSIRMTFLTTEILLNE